MARPERNSVDYFPHPISHGKGMFYMRTKYGNDGYTVWFMLLEKLGEASRHYLDLQNDLQMMYLSAEFKVKEDVLIEMVNDLVKIGDFDSELWKERILYNQKFVNSIADAYKKRGNSIIERDVLVDLLEQNSRVKRGKLHRKQDKGEPSSPVKPQSKVKDTKVKDSITLFNEFWDEYHRITGKAKTDKDAAYKHWKKFLRYEMTRAIEMIGKYFNSLDDPKYCKKARTYLDCRSFNDEFRQKKNAPVSVGMKKFEANDE